MRDAVSIAIRTRELITWKRSGKSYSSVLKMPAGVKWHKALLKPLEKGRVEVYSAGSRPSSQINPLAIEVMKEKDIDLSGRDPKG